MEGRLPHNRAYWQAIDGLPEPWRSLSWRARNFASSLRLILFADGSEGSWELREAEELWGEKLPVVPDAHAVDDVNKRVIALEVVDSNDLSLQKIKQLEDISWWLSDVGWEFWVIRVYPTLGLAEINCKPGFCVAFSDDSDNGIVKRFNEDFEPIAVRNTLVGVWNDMVPKPLPETGWLLKRTVERLGPTINRRYFKPELELEVHW